MIHYCKTLPTLRQRYSTSYGVPIWRSRVSGWYYCRLSRNIVMCVDDDDYLLMIEKCRIYKREKLPF